MISHVAGKKRQKRSNKRKRDNIVARTKDEDEVVQVMSSESLFSDDTWDMIILAMFPFISNGTIFAGAVIFCYFYDNYYYC